MRTQFQEILALVRAGQPAERSFTVEDTEYVRNFYPKERLILLGCGHVSQPVCQYASDLGFAVTVADDRPSFANHTRFPDAEKVICDSFEHAIGQLGINERDYVAVITRGHRYDADCLRAILPGTFPKYLGMTGSRRRVISLMKMLAEEGFPRELNWISVPGLHGPMRVKAKTRYRQAEQPATVYPEGPDCIRLEFDQPQRAVTVGQALVLYDGDLVVGGGTISRVPEA